MPIKIKGTEAKEAGGVLGGSGVTDYGSHLSGSQSIASTTKTKSAVIDGKMEPVGIPEISHEVAMDPGFIPPHKLCNVHFGGGRKFNIGNYESLDIHVSISVPCTKETLEDTYTFANDFIDTKLTALREEIEGADDKADQENVEA